MTTMQLREELFRELNPLLDSEEAMKRLIKYAKKIAAPSQPADDTEYLLSSSPMAEVIRQGQKDIENGRGKAIKVEDLWK